MHDTIVKTMPFPKGIKNSEYSRGDWRRPWTPPPPPEEWCRRHPIATFQKASCFKLYWESAL